jgi:CheY-specific phosphatase CheX
MNTNEMVSLESDDKRPRVLVGHCVTDTDTAIVIGLVGDERTLIRLELDVAREFSRRLARLVRLLSRSHARKTARREP